MPRGRPRKKVTAELQEVKNPYPPQQEAKYMSWEHGYTAKSETECPYDAEDSDYKELRKIWLAGWKANKTNKKPTEETAELAAEILSVGSVESIDKVPTELLEQELKKRKTRELEMLKQKEQSLSEQLKILQKKIEKLTILFGEE